MPFIFFNAQQTHLAQNLQCWPFSVPRFHFHHHTRHRKRRSSGWVNISPLQFFLKSWNVQIWGGEFPCSELAIWRKERWGEAIKNFEGHSDWRQSQNIDVESFHKRNMMGWRSVESSRLNAILTEFRWHDRWCISLPFPSLLLLCKRVTESSG